MEQRVIFTGFRADARQLYSLFDLFVLNSLDDPYPLAIVEAAAAGFPVIASSTIGAVAMADHLPIRLVPVGSHVDLARAIAEARMQPLAPIKPDLGSHSIEQGVAEILATYRQVTTRSHASPGRAERRSGPMLPAPHPADHA